MKRFALLVMVACGRLNGDDQQPQPGTDAGGDVAQCEKDFETQIDRQCFEAADCVLAGHPDCCGPVLIGISGSADASAAESTYESCEASACGPVGCDHPEESEDGMTPGPNQMIVAECVQNRCSSTVVTFMP